ncbi:hypothetical protein WN51_10619 [Melipona quadrifasciata]|uniref:Uncharacterized protein n=1 Tax=Melipona quadrifasciata TaxID=166423 RepID=A0A0M8ZPZ1_9HYME|nr:hypothetical protein WN51_10619 [Melipona quadrifasciata]
MKQISTQIPSLQSVPLKCKTARTSAAEDRQVTDNWFCFILEFRQVKMKQDSTDVERDKSKNTEQHIRTVTGTCVYRTVSEKIIVTDWDTGPRLQARQSAFQFMVSNSIGSVCDRSRRMDRDRAMMNTLPPVRERYIYSGTYGTATYESRLNNGRIFKVFLVIVSNYRTAHFLQHKENKFRKDITRSYRCYKIFVDEPIQKKGKAEFTMPTLELHSYLQACRKTRHFVHTSEVHAIGIYYLFPLPVIFRSQSRLEEETSRYFEESERRLKQAKLSATIERQLPNDPRYKERYIYIDVFENVGSRLQGVCCSHLAPLQPVLGWPCVESASPPPTKKRRTTLRVERAHAEEEKDGGDVGLEGEEGHSFNKTGEIAGSKANVRGAWTPPLATLSHEFSTSKIYKYPSMQFSNNSPQILSITIMFQHL